MISITHKGGFNNAEKFLNKLIGRDYLNILSKYGERGVEALRANTPVNSGQTANAWGYEIESGFGKTTLWWTNSNFNKGYNIAVILQYGHATRNGAYFEGVDYVNPALAEIFNNLADELWQEVTK